MLDIPEIGSLWLHKKGNTYKVIVIANTDAEKQIDYPLSIVYQNVENGKTWCRPFSRWHQSMKKINNKNKL